MSSVSVDATRSSSRGCGPARGRPETVCGFGRVRPVLVTLVAPRDGDEVAELLSAAGAEAAANGLIARGAGMSYGDAAQNEHGLVLDTSGLAGIHGIDSRTGDVTVGAGTRLAVLLRELSRHGLTLPVVPGTSAPTVGGAIAADVHGKNHRRVGGFGAHVRALRLVTPARGELTVSREEHPDLFEATIGGMGLTGVVTRATLRTVVLREPFAIADVDRVGSIEQAIELIDGTPERHSHAIAWLDLLARGSSFTRAVVTRSRAGEQAGGPGELQLHEPRPAFAVPLVRPVLPAAARAFNVAYWARSPRRAREVPMSMAAASFPLDRVDGWNRVYGRGGLVQYQVAVPDGEEWVLRVMLEMLRARGLPMYLATLKRLGASEGGPLSFPIEGWTLAVDLPARADGLEHALSRADRLLAGAGGRVYLAKDVRLSREVFAAMYPRLQQFAEVRASVDPQELLRSDLSHRLGLTR